MGGVGLSPLSLIIAFRALKKPHALIHLVVRTSATRLPRLFIGWERPGQDLGVFFPFSRECGCRRWGGLCMWTRVEWKISMGGNRHWPSAFGLAEMRQGGSIW